MSPFVYVVQEPVGRRIDGSEKATMNLAPAERFGALRYVLPRGSDDGLMRDLDGVIDDLKVGLVGFTQEDYLLPVGNPLFILAAGAVAVQETGGPVRVLIWRGHGERIATIRSALPYVTGCLSARAIAGILKNEFGESGWPLLRDLYEDRARPIGRGLWDNVEPEGDLRTVLRSARNAGWRDPETGYREVLLDLSIGATTPAVFDREEFSDYSRS
jgi:hypothetical protein